MKKCLIYIIIFVFLSSISNYSIDYVLGKQITKQSPYYLSFASIGAIYLESRLDCWAKIKTSSSSQELQEYLADILQSLELVLDPENLNVFATNTGVVVSYELNHPEPSIFVSLKSDNKYDESYFMVSIISRNKATQLEDYEARLNQILGLKWQYYYLYQGEIPHRIAEESQVDLANVVLKNMQAKKIETYQENGLTSITAYSSDLNKKVPALYIKGEKYNIQVALAGNSRPGKTRIYIGAPLILGEY